MADPLGNFVPEFIENEVEREAIVKLAKMITDRVPQKLGMKKITKYDPEYWGLSAMCTDEMAEIALKMGVRKPKTLDQMVKLTGIEKKHLEEVLQQMAVNGVIEYNWENPQHEKQYVLPMFVPGSAEFGNMNLQMLEEHPEVGRFFERMSRLPLEKVTPMVPEGGAGIGMHVIPVEKAISMETHVPAAAPARRMKKDVRMIRRAGASQSATWLIMLLRRIRADVTSQERKH